MSYTPPAGNAANFSWVGVAAYTPPAGGAANFAWAEDSAAGVAGDAAGTLDFTGGASVAHGISAICAGTLGFTGAAEVEHEGITVEAVVEGVLDFTGAVAAAHGIAATCAGTLDFTGDCAAQHLRYEVRGEVRMGGVLVNRRVRCYKRATGDLTGQADTVAGVYRVHAGFDEAEVYVTAIDMAEAATDWIPPVANRLVPVLADDTA